MRQKARIQTDKGERTLYLDVHAANPPMELFVKVKGCPPTWEELEAAYNIIARAYSLALQYGAPLETVGKQLLGVRCHPAGPVIGDARIKNCTSVPDYLGRHLLVHWCGHEDLAHVPKKEI